ncbi:TPM domain-containing protein [Gelidibacter maritimus]|uniref:TPM domain-containing protein n=1 Tax=Gelidibacter maritimus TaxID=2761487 RepID=A0A7W2R3F6_9FLAO|nr:TPM domain-containing protein [Gelidibacter maritimus]MBA6151960.1 TPM domain-containing protein [Gelidibacter maritimus]
MKAYILFLWMSVFIQSTGFSQQIYPQLHEFSTDQANVMSNEQLRSLRQKLIDFETETSHQIVVLTIESLGNESIENYALQVFEQNKIGQLDRDNGLLILFAAEERAVRIEVGYGLEPIITDAISSRLIRTIMIPEFKKERYFKGIDLATDEIISIISDPKYFIDSENIEEFGYEDDNFRMIPWWGKFLIILFFGIFLTVFLFIGFPLLKNGFKDMVNLFRGLFSGEIGIFLFPFMFVGICFSLIFGLVFTFAPLIAFSVMLSQVVFYINFDTLISSVNDMRYFSLNYVLITIGVLLVGLPILIAVLMVLRYNNGFKLSLLKSNNGFINKNLSFRQSTASKSSGLSSYSRSSRSSGFSRSSSSSRSSFSGGGGRSGGGGASGHW